MKAIILAGGFGKRLRPLTDDKPKPLVEIANRPIIEWQVLWLKKMGIKTFVVLEGYKKEALINWLTDNESRLGVRFIHITENEPLGTGGAIYKAKEIVDEKFIVINGDIITNIDVSKLSCENAVATISLVPLRSPYGVVETSDDKISKFVEKPILKDFWINAGIYLFTSKIFEYLPEKGDMEKTTFPQLASKGLLKGMKFENAYWRSIDSIKDVEEASLEINDALGSLDK